MKLPTKARTPHMPGNGTPNVQRMAATASAVTRLASGGVGGWRGSSYVGVLLPSRETDCVLFHPPLPEPCLQLSPHTALQWPESHEVGWVCRHHGRIRRSPNHTPGISPP